MTVRAGLSSSGSVSDSHPDKLADQCVVIAGDFKTRSPETFRAARERFVTIASGGLRDAGYRDSGTGLDPDSCEIQVWFNSQSADITQGPASIRPDGLIW
jgi:S-adenosylmethionine synthetase